MPEARTIAMIKHPNSRQDDRAAELLAARGYRLDWRCPGEGCVLPEPSGEHAGAVVYGGPESANDCGSKAYIRAELDWIGRWIAADKPFLGICLGSQLLARALGAQVSPHPERVYEIGYVPIAPTAAGAGFLDGPLHVYHWHKEGFELPAGAELLATGPVFPNQAFRYGASAYGVQFHPEVTPTIFRRWIEEAAHCLAEPGAQPPARQIADGARYDRALGDWLEGFLDRWLGLPEAALRPAAPAPGRAPG